MRRKGSVVIELDLIDHRVRNGTIRQYLHCLEETVVPSTLIGYGVNIPWVRSILEETVRGVEGVLEDKPVNILFTGFGDSAMDFRVRWWVSTPGEKRAVTDAVCAAIQETAEEKGIDMPNPTYSLDNTVRIDTKDASRMSELIAEAMGDTTAQAEAGEGRGS